MLPTTIIDRTVLEDGSEFSLVRRGEEWTVRVGGKILMSSRTSASEIALAELALARAPFARSVLVGGQGLGYTLRAVLDRVSSTTKVSISELVPALVAWNRDHVGHLMANPLDDPRSELTIGDVFEHIQQARDAFDVILLDVDNGPSALSTPNNRRLYTEGGVRACRRALRARGVLAVWSRGSDAHYQRRLEGAGFDVEVLRVPAFERGRARHVLFIATVRTPGAVTHSRQ